VGGCSILAPKRPTLEPPQARLSVAQFVGAALAGPAARPIEEGATAGAWTVSARIVAVDVLPSDPSFQPIGPQARLVIASQPQGLFSPSAQLIGAVRLRPLDGTESLAGLPLGLAQQAEVGSLTGAVAPGSTFAFEIALPDDAPATAELAWRSLAVAVSRGSDAGQYDLVLTGEELLGTPQTVGQEKLVLHREFDDEKDELALSAPMRFPDSPAAGLIIELTIDSKANAETIAELQKQLDAASATARERMTGPSPTAADAAIDAALDAIATSTPNRATLAWLSSETGARVAGAVVMVADDKALALIVGQVRSRLENLTSRDRAGVAWLLDRATIDAVASIKQEDSPTTLPPIQGALVMSAGEVGRQLDLLQSLANQAAGSADLSARITAENLIALEDNSPSARVRAYDWLEANGAAPPGYDPLAPPRQRRAALEAFAEAATTQPTTGVSGE
jgi:hypothetical protein